MLSNPIMPGRSKRSPARACSRRFKILNRLESTAFYIDTIIKTEKPGNWYALWQDAQSGLFMAKGQVVAGIDLNKLSAENVNVVNNKVIISLPPVEILSVNLDNIEVYDLKTGSLGLHPIDKSVFETVQQAAEEVLESACKADILAHAQNQAQQQLETLLCLGANPSFRLPRRLAAVQSSLTRKERK